MAADTAGSQRLFVALPCPLTPPISALLAELRELQRDAASGVRVVEADTLHVTLSFLGAIAPDRLPGVHAAIDELRGLPAPRLAITGAGHFSHVLWLSVALNPELAELAQRCDAALRTRGFALEERPFHPHVTVARLKQRSGFEREAWCASQRDMRWAEYSAQQVHLYRSDSTPDGSRYRIIHSLALR